MDDPKSTLLDAFWKMYLEHCTQVRHHETQRSSVASAFVAIGAALVGLITFDKELTPRDLPSALFLLGLGLFGGGFCAKQWERACMHARRAKYYRDEIDKVLGGTEIKRLKQEADRDHKGKFRHLHRLRLHKFWIGLYVGIALLGGVLSFMALPRDASSINAMNSISTLSGAKLTPSSAAPSPTPTF